MILIADAHISCNNTRSEHFFEMLDTISRTKHDVIFLGDIFELWIAFPRYESAMHLAFLDWCKKEKQQRSIGFIEGNHEFFLKAQYEECFTWSSTDFWLDEQTKTLFGHGDLLNKNDISYRRFRAATKNIITKNIVRFMPLAPQLVNYIKRKLTNTDKRRGYLPQETLQAFAQATFSDKVKQIVVGHFHKDFRLEQNDCRLIAVPDWMDDEKVSIYHDDIKEMYSCHWSKISDEVSI